MTAFLFARVPRAHRPHGKVAEYRSQAGAPVCHFADEAEAQRGNSSKVTVRITREPEPRTLDDPPPPPPHGLYQYLYRSGSKSGMTMPPSVPPGDIWQCSGTVLVATRGEGSTSGIEYAPESATTHRRPPQRRTFKHRRAIARPPSPSWQGWIGGRGARAPARVQAFSSIKKMEILIIQLACYKGLTGS